MKKMFLTMTLIIGILLTGCSSDGLDGSSKIVFAEDGMGANLAESSGVTYTYQVDIEGYDWDGTYDINTLEDAHTYDCFSDAPNHTISPGTYDYTVTKIATDDGSVSGTAAVFTLIYCTTTHSDCPDDGIPNKTALIIDPNLIGGEAASLFEDGAAGADMYYLFKVSHPGEVFTDGGIAAETCDY